MSRRNHRSERFWCSPFSFFLPHVLGPFFLHRLSGESIRHLLYPSQQRSESALASFTRRIVVRPIRFSLICRISISSSHASLTPTHLFHPFEYFSTDLIYSTTLQHGLRTLGSCCWASCPPSFALPRDSRWKHRSYQGCHVCVRQGFFHQLPTY